MKKCILYNDCKFSEKQHSNITDPRFHHMVDSSLPSAPWITRQIIYFIQCYFQTFTIKATDLILSRNVVTEINEAKYNVNDYRESKFMFKSFHDGLLHAMNCINLGLLPLPLQT